MSSPAPKRPRIDPPDADTVDATVSARPSSTANANETVVTSGSQSAERVNPVFGPGFATKFDNFSILPRIVREAVYSCVDWDTSRALKCVIPETEQYYARRPYKMEMVIMTYTPDYTCMPFSDFSAFAIDYQCGQASSKKDHAMEVHTLGKQQFDWVPGYISRFTDVMCLPEGSRVLVVRDEANFFLYVHKLSYKPEYIYRNLPHVHAAVFCVQAVSFFADTPSSLEPLRHRPSELCVVFDDVDIDSVNRILRLPIRETSTERRMEVDMDNRPEVVVSGTRDWLRYVQPTNGLVLIVDKAMTVPAGVFNLKEVKSAMEIMIHSSCRKTEFLATAKIDITIAQLRALNANCIRFEFEMPSVPLDELLLFVMDKIKAWLVDPDPNREYHFLFNATVTQSNQLEFITELSNLELGNRFKTHSLSGGVWIKGDFIPIKHSSILEDTKFGRHLLISYGSQNTVGIYPLHPCKGYDNCQCVIGRGPCKADKKE